MAWITTPEGFRVIVDSRLKTFKLNSDGIKVEGYYGAFGPKNYRAYATHVDGSRLAYHLPGCHLASRGSAIDDAILSARNYQHQQNLIGAAR